MFVFIIKLILEKLSKTALFFNFLFKDVSLNYSEAALKTLMKQKTRFMPLVNIKMTVLLPLLL